MKGISKTIKRPIFDRMNRQPESIQPLDLPIVFVLAKGRSGTTLLQTMLEAHPNTVAPLESRFVVHFRNRYGSVKRWTPSVKKRFIEDVLSELKISLFWEMDVPALTRRIELLPEDSSYGLVCKQVYVSRVALFEQQEPKVIIDKNPIHALLLPLITDVFPDARFIHVIRDYRANSSSFYKFQPHKTMRELGHMWVLYNEKIERLKTEKPNRFHTLRYESLVREPEHELREISDFLGLSFDPMMVNYHGTIGELYDAYVRRSPSEKVKKIRELASQTVHKNLTRPLDARLLNTWKEKLTGAQIETLNSICSEYAARYTDDAAVNHVEPKIPKDIKFKAEKLLWYYRLPIWLRELKSKPNLALLPKNDQ